MLKLGNKIINNKLIKKLFKYINAHYSKNKNDVRPKNNKTNILLPMDLKDIAIINSFPVIIDDPVVLNVGCGLGRIDHHIANLGYKVYAVDWKKRVTWTNIDKPNIFLKYCVADIYDLKSFPIKKAPIVICSQVLEHLKDYKKAIKNLLELTEYRLIITVPFEKSFGGKFAPPPEGHCNFWSEKRKILRYKDIHEFNKICMPFSVSISKIRTKREDKNTNKYNYLIIIDKTQDIILHI